MFKADEYPSRTYKNKSYVIAEKRLARLKKDKSESSEVYKRWVFVYAAICSDVWACKNEIVSNTYNRYFKSTLEKSPLKSADIDLMRKFSAEVYSFRGLNGCFICNFPSPGKRIRAVDMYLDTVLKAHENGFYKNEDIASVINILERDYYSGWPLKKAVHVYELYLSNETNLTYTNFNSLVLERLVEMKSELTKRNIVDWDATIEYARLLNAAKLANFQNDDVASVKKKSTLVEALIWSSFDFKNDKANLVSDNYIQGVELFKILLEDYSKKYTIHDKEYLLFLSKFKKIFEKSKDTSRVAEVKNKLQNSIKYHLENLKSSDFVLSENVFDQLVAVSDVISDDHLRGEAGVDFKFNNLFRDNLELKFSAISKNGKKSETEETVLLKARYAALIILFHDLDIYLVRDFNKRDKNKAMIEKYTKIVESSVSLFQPGSVNYNVAMGIQNKAIKGDTLRTRAATATMLANMVRRVD